MGGSRLTPGLWVSRETNYFFVMVTAQLQPSDTISPVKLLPLIVPDSFRNMPVDRLCPDPDTVPDESTVPE
jgi:hypothetical protein